MTSNLTLINQSVSRASLLSSRLPNNCNKIQHLTNNLVAKSDSRLLFIGHEWSYAVYDNSHTSVTFIEDGTKPMSKEVLRTVAPYNLVIVAENNFSAKLLPDLKEYLAVNVILAVINSRVMITEKLIDRSVGFVPNLRVFSKVEIYDRNDERGWGNGILLYDLVNK